MAHIESIHGFPVRDADAQEKIVALNRSMNAHKEAINKRFENVQDCKLPYVTPQYFGAVGDGLADDTEAIRMAINETGLDVVFPAGSYRVTSPIYIDRPHATLIGAGGKIVVASNSNVIFCPRAQYVTIDGLNFEGDSVPTAYNNTPVVYFRTVESDVGDRTEFYGTVRNCTFRNLSQRAISIGSLAGENFTIKKYSMHVTVENCVFDCVNIGVCQSGAYYTTVRGCIFNATNNEAITVDNRCSYAKVIDCVFARSTNGGIGRIGVDGSNNILISGNHFINASALPNIALNNAVSSSDGVIIDGNIFVGGTHGVYFYAARNGVNAGVNVTINNNVFTGHTTKSASILSFGGSLHFEGNQYFSDKPGIDLDFITSKLHTDFSLTFDPSKWVNTVLFTMQSHACRIKGGVCELFGRFTVVENLGGATKIFNTLPFAVNSARTLYADITVSDGCKIARLTAYPNGDIETLDNAQFTKGSVVRVSVNFVYGG